MKIIKKVKFIRFCKWFDLKHEEVVVILNIISAGEDYIEWSLIYQYAEETIVIDSKHPLYTIVENQITKELGDRSLKIPNISLYKNTKKLTNYLLELREYRECRPGDTKYDAKLKNAAADMAIIMIDNSNRGIFNGFIYGYFKEVKKEPEDKEQRRYAVVHMNGSVNLGGFGKKQECCNPISYNEAKEYVDSKRSTLFRIVDIKKLIV